MYEIYFLDVLDIGVLIDFIPDEGLVDEYDTNTRAPPYTINPGRVMKPQEIGSCMDQMNEDIHIEVGTGPVI